MVHFAVFVRPCVLIRPLLLLKFRHAVAIVSFCSHFSSNGTVHQFVFFMDNSHWCNNNEFDDTSLVSYHFCCIGVRLAVFQTIPTFSRRQL